MDINKILKTDYLDILFDGRNKKYGGYELRKNYPKRVGKAFLLLLAIGLGTAAYAVISGLKPEKDDKKVVMMKEITLAEPPPIDPKKPPPPPPPPAPPPPVKPTVKFTPPVIKKDEEVKETEKPPEVKELEDKAPGIKTQEGDPDGIDPGIIDDPGPGTGAVEAPPPPEIFTYVQQMPEFPGNVNEYLSKNIRYPELARENNIQGRVIIRFVVNEDGDVSDVEVLKGIGGGCDEEAKRVVMKMPKWKPGRQNGKPVKVYYTLPISFRLE